MLIGYLDPWKKGRKLVSIGNYSTSCWSPDKATLKDLEQGFIACIAALIVLHCPPFA